MFFKSWLFSCKRQSINKYKYNIIVKKFKEINTFVQQWRIKLRKSD